MNFKLFLIIFGFIITLTTAEEHQIDYDECLDKCFEKYPTGGCIGLDCPNCTFCFDKLKPFDLTVVSARIENVIYEANITWDRNIMNDYKQCLITWEIFGGGLKGNLLTDTSKVELTLRSNKRYEIEVTCRNEETVRKSRAMIINSGADGLKKVKISTESSKNKIVNNNSNKNCKCVRDAKTCLKLYVSAGAIIILCIIMIIYVYFSPALASKDAKAVKTDENGNISKSKSSKKLKNKCDHVIDNNDSRLKLNDTQIV